MIDFSRFFYLTDPGATRPLRLGLAGEHSSIPDWFALARGKSQPSHPVQFRRHSGAALADFIWTAAPPLLCVSERVPAILREHDVKGWGTYDVTITDRNNQPVPGYCGFAVHSFAGNLDFSSSQIVTVPPRIPTGKAIEHYIGFTFDLTRWDGSDIFYVDGFMIVTDKVKTIFKRNHVTNVRLIPIFDVELVAPLVDILKKNRFD